MFAHNQLSEPDTFGPRRLDLFAVLPMIVLVPWCGGFHACTHTAAANGSQAAIGGGGGDVSSLERVAEAMSVLRLLRVFKLDRRLLLFFAALQQNPFAMKTAHTSFSASPTTR